MLATSRSHPGCFLGSRVRARSALESVSTLCLNLAPTVSCLCFLSLLHFTFFRISQNYHKIRKFKIRRDSPTSKRVYMRAHEFEFTNSRISQEARRKDLVFVSAGSVEYYRVPRYPGGARFMGRAIRVRVRRRPCIRRRGGARRDRVATLL